MTVLLFIIGNLFVPGERLEYDLRYGPVNLGSLVLRTLPIDTLAGTECYHFRADLDIGGALSWFFSASYQLESWCGTDGMVTVRSYKLSRETNYQSEWFCDYDQNSHQVHYSDGAEFQLPDSARDLLTLWFYLRTLELKPGDVRVVNGHIDRRNYRLRAQVSERKTVRTGAGVFDCLVVSPSAAGPLGTIFLADGPGRVPAVLRTRVAGLVVSAYLRQIRCEED